jgi:hypothetical protein
VNGPKVLPTFAVVPSFSAMIAVAGDLGANPMMILHGEQKVRLHRPIPPSGEFSTVAEVKGIYDKGKGALVGGRGAHRRQPGQPSSTTSSRSSPAARAASAASAGPRPSRPTRPRARPPDFEMVERDLA